MKFMTCRPLDGQCLLRGIEATKSTRNTRKRRNRRNEEGADDRKRGVIIGGQKVREETKERLLVQRVRVEVREGAEAVVRLASAEEFWEGFLDRNLKKPKKRVIPVRGKRRNTEVNEKTSTALPKPVSLANSDMREEEPTVKIEGQSGIRGGERS